MSSPICGSHLGIVYEVYIQQEWGQQERPCAQCPRTHGHNRTIQIITIRSKTTFSYPNKQSSVWQHFDTILHQVFHDNTCLCANCLEKIERKIADHFQ